jgi:hypothetical protein
MQVLAHLSAIVEQIRRIHRSWLWRATHVRARRAGNLAELSQVKVAFGFSEYRGNPRGGWLVVVLTARWLLQWQKREEAEPMPWQPTPHNTHMTPHAYAFKPKHHPRNHNPERSDYGLNPSPL